MAQQQHPPAPTTEVTQTATIRNAVNLKKASLGVTPLPGNPNHLAVRFFFDASEACRCALGRSAAMCQMMSCLGVRAMSTART